MAENVLVAVYQRTLVGHAEENQVIDHVWVSTVVLAAFERGVRGLNGLGGERQVLPHEEIIPVYLQHLFTSLPRVYD